MVARDLMRWSASSLILLSGWTLGCDGSGEAAPTTTSPPDAECTAGETPAPEGGCIAAGLPPAMPCPPAEWMGDDGVCVPAGVPPGGCAEGFLHDGDRGCEPVLPREECPPGLIAVPGDSMCREIAPCAPGQWGAIPVEPDTEYVDASYPGTDSDGTALKPWTSVQAGVDAAPSGAIVAIAEGSYVEDVTVSGKAVRLWGVCPKLVEVRGTGAEIAAIVVLPGADGTAVRDLALRGAAIGFGLSGSRDVLVERVWVHETDDRGMEISGALGSTSATVRASLIEQSHRNGLYFHGAEATIEASVVRDTQPDAEGLFGRGVSAVSNSTAPSTVVVRSMVVERNHDVGVYSEGSDVTVEASVIRRTQPSPQGSGGRGMNVHPDSKDQPSSLVLRSSLVEQNYDVGVFIEGSEATIEASVIRDTLPEQTRDLAAFGVGAQADPMTGAPSTLALRTSLIERTHGIGVYVHGSKATVDAVAIRDTLADFDEGKGQGVEAIPDSTTGVPSAVEMRSSLIEGSHGDGVLVEGSEAIVDTSVVRDTQPDATGHFGRAVSAQADPTTGAPSKLGVHASVIERSHELGIFVAGGEATIEASVVRDTQLDVDGLGGRGLHAQKHPVGTSSTLLLRSSLVEQSKEAGVAVLESAATIDACVIRDTQPSPGWGAGEGVIVASIPDAASVTITRTLIDRSALAAVASWGAHAAIGESTMSCQAFDLDAETLEGVAAVFEDLGGNLCGCPEPTASCQAVSAGLAPPSPLEPAQ